MFNDFIFFKNGFFQKNTMYVVLYRNLRNHFFGFSYSNQYVSSSLANMCS